ncbi:orofacial cleft 1 candidate gene 1 protein [Geospiza fortis]|uniref:Orofacial cleft 1 candidate gene 1 protein n=1 Tax=Geospiza fortis TaxID=48883 RepID=A0A6I9Z744_GEOFO|nr:orofacial cleft 1 candidate gene 1 protein [Geospiza fortis]
MEKEKFQQKALKQTKQKKSKSAEFLMVKEERAATEGIENPAFNISSTDLSAYQPSEEKVIRHDKADSTLAAHQQKLGLQAHAEPRGNEYSRNYFDPLMGEEINPRQCGMEVSEEDPVKFDEQILYSKLMKLLDEENKMLNFQARVVSEDFPDAVTPVSSSKACDLHRELEDEEIPSYIEQFERDVQDDIILLGSFSLEQVDCSKMPQPLEIHLRCLRGVKDKVPKGLYTLKVSVLSHLGGALVEWPELEEQLQARTTRPVSHDGNFYNTEIYFGQSIQTRAKLDQRFYHIEKLCNQAWYSSLNSSFFVAPIPGLIEKLLNYHRIQISKITMVCMFIYHLNLCIQALPKRMVRRNNPSDQCCELKSGPENNASQEEGKTSAETNFYLEDLEKYTFSVCCRSAADVKLSRQVVERFHFVVYTAFSELGATRWRSREFWLLALLVVVLWFLRLYLHYLSQWLFLRTISVPVAKFQLFPHTVELCYQNSLLHTSEELAMVVVGPLTLNAGLLLMVLIRWGCQQLFDSFPSFLSKSIIAMGLWTVLDPLAVFVVDSFLGRFGNSVEKPIADAAKLSWVFLRAGESAVPGALITLMLYIILFMISSTVLYLYFLRLHSEGWLMDVFRRIHGEEGTFFVPLDLEISSQELSYIMKRAEQWRGINGERRMVAVSDYIWKDHASQPGGSSCDLQRQDEIPDAAASWEGSTTVHVCVYTVHLSGFQELYRRFLRLPDGAIIEAFGHVGEESLLCKVSTDQEHKREKDSALCAPTCIKLRERKKSTARWKGNRTVSDKSQFLQ